MHRTLLLVSMIALAAIPAAAQGKSKEHRQSSQFRTSDARRSDSRASDDRSGRYRWDDRDDDHDDDARRGNRSKSERTYIDSRGLECREKTQIKKDGRRSYTTKCKERKNTNRSWNGRGTRDVNQCAYLDSRCDRLPTSGSTYPQSRVPTSTRQQPTMTEILGAIAASRTQR